VTFDNFSSVVPEPGAGLVISLAVGALLVRRRSARVR
jgi:hypothetical protein